MTIHGAARAGVKEPRRPLRVPFFRPQTVGKNHSPVPRWAIPSGILCLATVRLTDLCKTEILRMTSGLEGLIGGLECYCEACNHALVAPRAGFL